ncbi:hypothetical protein GOV12_05470 [Candidatus Pacearchaeota archaeon]|nr:hypothetical protein [Candidatus Pacearchaeota archaeon]
MVNRYLKLSTQEATVIKDQFDIAENKLNNIIRIIRNYRISRKKEIALKNKLKTSIIQLKTKINNLEISFPEDERIDYKRTHHISEEPIIDNEKRHIDHSENKTNDPFEDLNDIKSQLSRFEE